MYRCALLLTLLYTALCSELPAQIGYPRDPWRLPRTRYPKPAKDKSGHVKIETKAKEASVYVDGAYAGIAKKLKDFPLKPGKHDIELRDTAGHSYSERVHVLRGKTVTVRADLPQENHPAS